MADIDLTTLARCLDGEISAGQVLAPGPGHSAADRSLSIKLDDDAPDGFIVHSFAGDDPIGCRDYVREKAGLPPRKPGGGNGKIPAKGKSPIVAQYVYQSADGAPYLRVNRRAVKKDGFFQEHWTGSAWVPGAPRPKIPYRLPELLAASPTTPVYVTEGEKDSDSLAKLGFVATTNSEGADNGKGSKWTPELNGYFKDRHIIILPDNDAPGRQHARHVARNIDGVAASVKIVELPGLDASGDVSDFLEGDPSGARVVKECTQAPLWLGDADDADREEIGKLAALPKLKYAKVRKAKAKALGITAKDLDEAVDEVRSEKSEERWQVKAWDEAVNTAELLAELRDTYSRHVILPEHGAVTMALWDLHAWTIDAWYVSPFLGFRSPEMRCGKSTALSLIYWTGPRTSLASNITPAALFRYIEASHPTLLIDEADSFFGDNEELRGILNSGHTRDTAHVIRLIGDAHEPREFSTWSPKAIAAIGKLVATLWDRSIVIPLKRKKAHERVAKLRGRDSDEFLTLRRKAARWSADNIGTLKKARPALPEELNDRAADNWEPLLAIADLAGGDWPIVARSAARELSGDDAVDAQSTRVRLLADIRTIFATLEDARVSSASLVAELIKDDTGPWLSYGRSGKPITQRQVANLLSEFNIYPRTVRVAGLAGTPKGYDLDSFKDAFERYLPAVPPSQSATPPQVNDINDLDVAGRDGCGGSDADVADRDSRSATPNPLKTQDCCVVADRDPPHRKVADADRSCVQCRGPLDGKERCYEVSGRKVWLHPECHRFFVRVTS